MGIKFISVLKLRLKKAKSMKNDLAALSLNDATIAVV
jgi:hypothetical protein